MVERRKEALYENRTADVVAEHRRRHDVVAKSGLGTAQKRETLGSIATYIDKRRTNYGEPMRRDLEVSTGAVEGAIRALICRRLDHGSMRWIRERAEAVLQLRCIDMKFVHDKTRGESEAKGMRMGSSKGSLSLYPNWRTRRDIARSPPIRARSS